MVISKIVIMRKLSVSAVLLEITNKSQPNKEMSVRISHHMTIWLIALKDVD